MSEPTTDPRARRWQEVAEAVAAGCPVPATVYIAADAGLVRVMCLTADDVAQWASRLGLAGPVVSVYPADDVQHRMTLAERGSPAASDWLEVIHDEKAGDRGE